jgi:hypothetical protein
MTLGTTIMFSTSTLRRLPVALAVAGALCTFAVPQALAGGTAKDSPPVSAVPDVFERYTASHAYGDASAVPDVFERYAASHPYGKAAATPQRVGVPVYTPTMLAAHYNREDLLYNPRPSLPTNSGPPVSGGFDWSDWAIGIGTGLGLALIVGGGLLMGRHLRHRGIQTV